MLLTVCWHVMKIYVLVRDYVFRDHGWMGVCQREWTPQQGHWSGAFFVHFHTKDVPKVKRLKKVKGRHLYTATYVISVTDALELAGDRSFWRQIATAGCYGWSLRIMMMMMLMTYMNMTSSGLQCEVAYWLAMTLGGTAQVAAAHCLNEQTLDPAVCSYNRPTYAPPSCTVVFTLQCFK